MAHNGKYRIEGLFREKWTTLFDGFSTILEVAARVAELQKTNPACRYRWVLN
jgi:hypothetical protein